MVKIKCKCCGSEKLHVLIDFGMQPVAHNLLDDKEQKDIYTHLLCLHYCEECGFIQINNPIPPEELYTKYNYCFSAWKKQPHILNEIEMLNEYISDKEIKVLEVGCNDGGFLESLRKAGFKFEGCNPVWKIIRDRYGIGNEWLLAQG